MLTFLWTRRNPKTTPSHVVAQRVLKCHTILLPDKMQIIVLMAGVPMLTTLVVVSAVMRFVHVVRTDGCHLGNFRINLPNKPLSKV